jgi:hypothetical protein
MNFFRVRAPAMGSKPKQNIEENPDTVEVIEVSDHDLSPVKSSVVSNPLPDPDKRPSIEIHPPLPALHIEEIQSPPTEPVEALCQSPTTAPSVRQEEAVAKEPPSVRQEEAVAKEPQAETVCDITSEELLESSETPSPPPGSPTIVQLQDNLPAITKKRVRKKTQKYSEEQQAAEGPLCRSPSLSPEIAERLDSWRQRADVIIETLTADHRFARSLSHFSSS